MAQITIRVGASVDRSVANALRPLGESAKRARAQVDTEMKGASRAIAKESKKGHDAAEAEFKKLVAELEGKGGKMMAPAVKGIKTFGDEAKKNFDAVKGQFKSLASEAEKNFRAVERNRATALRDNGVRGFVNGVRETGRASAREIGKDLAGRAGSSLLSGAKALPGMALGATKSFAESLGANFDIASHMKQAVDLESAATTLSNNAYMPGADGAAGRRVDPKDLIDEVRGVGKATATDPTKAMAGLEKFVAKTGDLETGRQIIGDMAKLARATGASLDDVADAAGDVSSQLADGPDKAKQIDAVMRAVAGAGKVGAVEMKDFATQMAKVGAAASMFEGDAGENMKAMSAMVQMARAKGGAASATQAANTIGSFQATFAKGARLDEFEHFGVKVDGAGGRRRDPMAIIKDSLLAASSEKNGGLASFNRNMGDMFKDVNARRAVTGFEKAFLDAGGGDAGIKAVEAEFERLKNATMSQAEVNESFARSMNTTEAKVQLFNNELAASSATLKSSLQPALEALAPKFLDLAQSLTASITKAVGGDEKKLDQNTFAAYSTAHGANAVLKKSLGLSSDDRLVGQQAIKNGRVVEKSTVDAAEKGQSQLAEMIKQREASLEAKRAEGKIVDKNPVRMVGNLFKAGFDHATGRSEQRDTEIKAGEGDLARMKEQFDANKMVLEKVHAALTAGTLKVEVMNPEAIKGGPALGGGQTAAPGERR